MIINLISNFGEDAKLENIRVFNHTVAWFLREALEKKDIEVTFVRDHDLLEKSPPNADHTLVISGTAMYYVAGSPKTMRRYPALRGKTPTIRNKVKKATKGKIAVYLDADYPQWFEHFDYVFTVVKPRKHPKCVYAGWGADPEYCYPKQDEKAVFLDSLMYKFYGGRFNKIYDIYKETLPALGLKTYNPRPTYHGSKRLPWTQIQDMFRKSHYFCCTGLGESGLPRIESATCGALLVVPKPLYRPRTMASLEHKIWDTKADLAKIRTTETDPEAIRKKALVHSWDKVAARILATLKAGAV